MDSFINRSMESNRSQPMHGTAQQYRVLNRQEASSEVSLEFIGPPHTEIEDEGKYRPSRAGEDSIRSLLQAR